jgi:UMF1 family MFS transporter
VNSIRNDNRTVFGWALYDWANSAYAVAAGAIVAPFFTDVIVPEEGFYGMSGETLWALLVSFGTSILFLAMPVLGAVADWTASKRRFLWSFAWTGAVMTMVTPWVPAGAVVAFLLLFLVSQIGFTAANTFYDGFLPEITSDESIDRVSAKGFAYGYAGGGLFLVVALLLIVLSGDGGVTGLSETTATRLAIALAGLWWLGFSVPSMRRLPASGIGRSLPPGRAGQNRVAAYAAIGFRRTWDTTRKLRRFPQLLWFVIAYIVYMDGVQTVINISGAFAADTLDLSTPTIVAGFLIVQFVAFGGALAFGRLSDRIGAKRGILVGLVMWSGVVAIASFLPTGEVAPFLAATVLVGVVLGGVSALSRSLYGSMIPEEASAEFFGFFTVFSKFSAIWGPLLFGIISGVTGSGRSAISTVIVFFVVGGLLLTRVDVDIARADRARWSEVITESNHEDDVGG